MRGEAMSNVPAVVTSVAELAAWGDLAKKSGIVPPSTSREQAMAIVQTGRESACSRSSRYDRCPSSAAG